MLAMKSIKLAFLDKPGQELIIKGPNGDELVKITYRRFHPKDWKPYHTVSYACNTKICGVKHETFR